MDIRPVNPRNNPINPEQIAAEQDVAAKNVKAVKPRDTTEEKADALARNKVEGDTLELNREIVAETLLGEAVAGAEKQKDKSSRNQRVESQVKPEEKEQALLSKPKPASGKATGAQKGEELAAQLQVTANYEKLSKKKLADKETARLYAAMAKALGIIISTPPEEALLAVRENAEHEKVFIADIYESHERAVLLTVDGFLASQPTLELAQLFTR